MQHDFPKFMQKFIAETKQNIYTNELKNTKDWPLAFLLVLCHPPTLGQAW